jgi:hypothetical protein
MHEQDERVAELLSGAMPEVLVDDLPEWCDDDRSVSDLHGVLVATDPNVADMSYPEFCDEVLESGTTSVFTELVEVYDRDDQPAVYRVTGSRVVDPPRYFLDSTSALILLSGRYARAGFAVGLYDPVNFDESVLHYLDSYRLFSYPDRENQVEHIRRANELIDAILNASEQTNPPESPDDVHPH